MKTYLILDGSFRTLDGELRVAGQTIELDEVAAEGNAHVLQEVKPAEGGEETPAND